MRAIVVFCASLFVSSSASAMALFESLDEIKELSYRPQAQQSRFQAEAGYEELRWTLKGSGQTRKFEFNEKSMGVGYLYALSEDFAFGPRINYFESAGDTDFKNRGLGDIELRAVGRRTLSPDGILLLGVSGYLSPDENKAPTETDKGNRFSGGHSVKPSVGYRHWLGSGFGFANMSYLYNIGRKKSIDREDNEISELKGRHIFQTDLGFEFAFSDTSRLGIHGGYMNVGKGTTRIEEAGVRRDEYESKGVELLKVGTYFNAALNKALILSPSLQYVRPKTQQSDEYADVRIHYFIARVALNILF